VSVGVGVEPVVGEGSAGLDVGAGVEVGFEFPAGADVGEAVGDAVGAVGPELVEGLGGGSLGPATSALCVFAPATSPGGLTSEDFSGISIWLIEGVLVMDAITKQTIKRITIALPAINNTFGRDSE
jgi:hypothetical protein